MKTLVARLSKSQLLDWMQDSVVIDDNHNPLMVYHTTTTYFRRFSKKYLGAWNDGNSLGYALTALIGFWFSTNHFEDEWSKEVIGAYLKITNPIEYYNQHHLAEDLAIFSEEKWDIVDDWDMEKISNNYMKRIARSWVNQQKYYGYDGIVIEHDTEYKGTSYVVFDSSQIRIVKRYHY